MATELLRGQKSFVAETAGKDLLRIFFDAALQHSSWQRVGLSLAYLWHQLFCCFNFFRWRRRLIVLNC
jgi:hypothetical protein